MKKNLVLGVMALLCLQVFAQGPAVVRFGVEATYAPFESKLPDGQLVGFEIDLGKAICQKMGAKCEWVENDFDSIIPALLAKKFDAILSGMNINETRKKQINFTEKIHSIPGALVVKADSNLTAAAESLRGKTVGVQQGTTYEAYGRKYWSPKGVNLVTYKSVDLAQADLVVGRLDGFADNASVMQESFLSKPAGKPFKMVLPYLRDQEIFGVGGGIGVRKEDTDLLARLNKAIAEIRKDGTYDQIARKYFSFDPYGD
jgi:histidine transport system substrate-binding protein